MLAKARFKGRKKYFKQKWYGFKIKGLAFYINFNDYNFLFFESIHKN
jgi:hypothetical protein